MIAVKNHHSTHLLEIALSKLQPREQRVVGLSLGLGDSKHPGGTNCPRFRIRKGYLKPLEQKPQPSGPQICCLAACFALSLAELGCLCLAIRRPEVERVSIASVENVQEPAVPCLFLLSAERRTRGIPAQLPLSRTRAAAGQKPSRAALAGLAGFPQSRLPHPTVTAPQALELEAPPVTYKQGHFLKDMAPISNIGVLYERLEYSCWCEDRGVITCKELGAGSDTQ